MLWQSLYDPSTILLERIPSGAGLEQDERTKERQIVICQRARNYAADRIARPRDNRKLKHKDFDEFVEIMDQYCEMLEAGTVPEVLRFRLPSYLLVWEWRVEIEEGKEAKAAGGGVGNPEAPAAGSVEDVDMGDAWWILDHLRQRHLQHLRHLQWRVKQRRLKSVLF